MRLEQGGAGELPKLDSRPVERRAVAHEPWLLGPRTSDLRPEPPIFPPARGVEISALRRPFRL